MKITLGFLRGLGKECADLPGRGGWEAVLLRSVSPFFTYCVISALAQLQIDDSFPLFLLCYIERSKLSCITGCLKPGTLRIPFPLVIFPSWLAERSGSSWQNGAGLQVVN